MLILEKIRYTSMEKVKTLLLVSVATLLKYCWLTFQLSVFRYTIIVLHELLYYLFHCISLLLLPLMSTIISNHKSKSLLFFFCSMGCWTQGLHLESLHQPFFFCDGLFEIWSHELFAPAGFEPPILLIFVSWVARITGVSHQCRLKSLLLILYVNLWYLS
jgi:hypothetical protein